MQNCNLNVNVRKLQGHMTFKIKKKKFLKKKFEYWLRKALFDGF